MSRPPEPIFLARQTYRRRRLEDAARVLPALGVLLLLAPILWASDATTRGGLIYVFLVWAVLIVLVGPISMRLSDRVRGAEDSAPPDESSGPEADKGDA